MHRVLVGQLSSNVLPISTACTGSYLCCQELGAGEILHAIRLQLQSRRRRVCCNLRQCLQDCFGRLEECLEAIAFDQRHGCLERFLKRPERAIKDIVHWHSCNGTNHSQWITRSSHSIDHSSESDIPGLTASTSTIDDSPTDEQSSNSTATLAASARRFKPTTTSAIGQCQHAIGSLASVDVVVVVEVVVVVVVHVIPDLSSNGNRFARSNRMRPINSA
jgi:hypothetical protein